MIKPYLLASAIAALAAPASASERSRLDALIAQHARDHGVPEALVHRVVQRESGYNPRASNSGNLGLMQIRYATAQGMGYTGPAAGLLDANTNLTNAVPYLANAYKVAGGNTDRAVSLYAGGYYYEAKRKALLGQLRTGRPVAASAGYAGPTTVRSWLSSVFAAQPPSTIQADRASQAR